MHDQLSLSILVERYLDARSGELETSTAYHTRLAWRRLIEVVGDVDVATFSSLHAEDFRAALLRVYRPATASSYIKTVRPVIRWWARRCGRADPFLGLAKVRVPKERPIAYDTGQVNSLLGAAATVRERLIWLLGVTTGMRRGEIANLIWADVDLKHKEVTIQAKAETTTTWRWIPKDKDAGTLPLTDAAVDLLLQIRMELPRSQPYVTLTEERYAYLQWRRSRGQMSDRQRRCPDTNRGPLERARKKAGVEGASLRHLRSTCLTKLADEGVPPHVVQRVARHSSVETTLRYYIADRCHFDRIREIGATGLEPATS